MYGGFHPSTEKRLLGLTGSAGAVVADVSVAAPSARVEWRKVTKCSESLLGHSLPLGQSWRLSCGVESSNCCTFFRFSGCDEDEDEPVEAGDGVGFCGLDFNEETKAD